METDNTNITTTTNPRLFEDGSPHQRRSTAGFYQQQQQCPPPFLPPPPPPFLPPPHHLHHHFHPFSRQPEGSEEKKGGGGGEDEKKMVGTPHTGSPNGAPPPPQQQQQQHHHHHRHPNASPTTASAFHSAHQRYTVTNGDYVGRNRARDAVGAARCSRKQNTNGNQKVRLTVGNEGSGNNAKSNFSSDHHHLHGAVGTSLTNNSGPSVGPFVPPPPPPPPPHPHPTKYAEKTNSSNNSSQQGKKNTAVVGPAAAAAVPTTLAELGALGIEMPNLNHSAAAAKPRYGHHRHHDGQHSSSFSHPPLFLSNRYDAIAPYSTYIPYNFHDRLLPPSPPHLQHRPSVIDVSSSLAPTTIEGAEKKEGGGYQKEDAPAQKEEEEGGGEIDTNEPKLHQHDKSGVDVSPTASRRTHNPYQPTAKPAAAATTTLSTTTTAATAPPLPLPSVQTALPPSATTVFISNNTDKNDASDKKRSPSCGDCGDDDGQQQQQRDGVWKKVHLSVDNFSFAHFAQIEDIMTQFFEWLTSEVLIMMMTPQQKKKKLEMLMHHLDDGDDNENAQQQRPSPFEVRFHSLCKPLDCEVIPLDCPAKNKNVTSFACAKRRYITVEVRGTPPPSLFSSSSPSSSSSSSSSNRHRSALIKILKSEKLYVLCDRHGLRCCWDGNQDASHKYLWPSPFSAVSSSRDLFFSPDRIGTSSSSPLPPPPHSGGTTVFPSTAADADTNSHSDDSGDDDDDQPNRDDGGGEVKKEKQSQVQRCRRGSTAASDVSSSSMAVTVASTRVSSLNSSFARQHPHPPSYIHDATAGTVVTTHQLNSPPTAAPPFSSSSHAPSAPYPSVASTVAMATMTTGISGGGKGGDDDGDGINNIKKMTEFCDSIRGHEKIRFRHRFSEGLPTTSMRFELANAAASRIAKSNNQSKIITHNVVKRDNDDK